MLVFRQLKVKTNMPNTRNHKIDTFQDVPESELRFPSLGAGTDSMLQTGSRMSAEDQAREDALDELWAEREGDGESFDTRHPVDRAIAKIAVRELSQTEDIDVRVDSDIAA